MKISGIHVGNRIWTLLVVLLLSPVAVIHWYAMYNPSVFFGVTYASLQNALSLCTILVCFSMLFVAWQAWKQLPNSRDGFMGATFFVVGVLHFTAMAIPTGQPYEFFAQMIAVAGLLICPYLRRRSRQSYLQWSFMLKFALLLSALLLGVATYSRPVISPDIKAVGQYILAALCFWAAFLYRRRNPRRRQGFLMALALVVLSASLLVFAGNYVVWGQLYQLVSYVIILGNVGISLNQPSARITRLHTSLKKIVSRYGKLTKVSEENRRLLLERLNQVSAEKSHRLLRDLFDQIRGIAAGKTTHEDLYSQIVNMAARMLDSTHVFLVLTEGPPAVLKTVAYKSVFKLEDLDWKTGFTKKILLEGKTLLIDDLSRYAKYKAAEAGYGGFKSMLGVPLIFEGQAIGAIELLSRQQNSFSNQDATTLLLFAQHAAVAVRCAGMMTGSDQCRIGSELVNDVVRITSEQTDGADVLSQVTLKLCAVMKIHAIAAFVVRNQTGDLQSQAVFVRNFTESDIQNLKRMMGEIPPSMLKDGGSADAGAVFLNKSVVNFARTGGKSADVLPLWSRNILQGLIVFVWQQARNTDVVIKMEPTLQIIANQTALGLERASLYESIRELGFTDALTGLSNRRFFDFSISRELERAKRYGKSVSLLLLDIDFFKNINDTFGHQAGDLVLKEMGFLIKNHFRKTDLSARYGGEEFVIILPETDSTAAIALAERFRRAVEQVQFLQENGYTSITISIGVATASPPDLSPGTELFSAADQALYQAKESGRNRVVLF